MTMERKIRPTFSNNEKYSIQASGKNELYHLYEI